MKQKSNAVQIIASAAKSPNFKPTAIRELMKKLDVNDKGFLSSKPSKKKDGFFAKIFGSAPQSVQQSIPYLNMYRDGICRVSERQYNKTIQFFDINYQLAQADDQALIFENYCEFLNYFDSSIAVQLTLVNQRTNIRDFNKVCCSSVTSSFPLSITSRRIRRCIRS